MNILLMRAIEEYYIDIQRQLIEAIKNPEQIHQRDEEKIEKIFCDILELDIEYEVDDVKVIIDELGPKYSKYTKNIILEIALYKLRLHFKKMYKKKN
jgi:hypothetical protein